MSRQATRRGAHRGTGRRSASAVVVGRVCAPREVRRAGARPLGGDCLGRLRRVAAALLGAACLAVIAPAAVSAACQPGEVSTPFAQFGDDASYAVAPGGTFLSGTAAWDLEDVYIDPYSR